MLCLSLSGLCWAKKTAIFILSTQTIMTVPIRCGLKKIYILALKINHVAPKLWNGSQNLVPWRPGAKFSRQMGVQPFILLT